MKVSHPLSNSILHHIPYSRLRRGLTPMSNKIYHKDDDDFQVSKTNSSSPSISTTTAFGESKKVVVAAKKRRKKEYAWKRPTDKPKRPACAYNLFFYLERERILGGDDERRLYTAVDAARAAAAMSHDKPKRKHVKTHGMIAFTVLSKTIASHWKHLAPSAREVFEYQASLQATDYANKLAEWKQKQKELSERDSVDGSSSPSIDTPSTQRRSSVDTFATYQDSNYRDIITSGQATHLDNDPPLTTMIYSFPISDQSTTVRSKNLSNGDDTIQPYSSPHIQESHWNNQEYIDEPTVPQVLDLTTQHIHVSSSDNNHFASTNRLYLYPDVLVGDSLLPLSLPYHNSRLRQPSYHTYNDNSLLLSDDSEYNIINNSWPHISNSFERIHSFEENILFHPLDRIYSFEDNILLNNDLELSHQMFGKPRLIPLHDAQLDRMVEELFPSGNDPEEEEPYLDVSVNKASFK